jgi:thioredoxin reductase (NADPH)
MRLKIAPLLIASLLALTAVAIMAPRSSYEPGALMRAHAQLTGDCAACHQAWRGPQNQRCVACHGPISDDNPHSGVDISDEDSGLMPGRKLAHTNGDNLACLSCHGEHQGAVVNVKTAAAFACVWCHKHPSIGKVPEHVVPVMARNYPVKHLFARPFNHFEHKLLIESHYPPLAGGFACVSCHLVQPVNSGQPEQMSLKWSGCAGIGCHVSPQDSFMQMPASIGPEPKTIPYSGVIRMRHIQAVFVHSEGHLRSGCADCHFKMKSSRNPSDADSLAIRQCFTCHAHRPGAIVKSASIAPTQAGAAYAADVAGRRERRVTACGQCHLFHNFGVVPLNDFPKPAPNFPPGWRRHALLTLYVPHLERVRGAKPNGIGYAPLTITPWWLGLTAVGLIALSFGGYLVIAPRKEGAREAVAGVAPQRTSEVPLIDDTYQTSVRHLYIVGEAAGTASINLAMRSGRQVLEGIAAELKRMPRASESDLYDVLIVGCGPAGLGATATAASMGLNYVTLERMTPASTLRAYPRAKFVQATPIDIAEYGSLFLEGDNSREQLIEEWERIIDKLGLRIKDREEVVGITISGERFFVRTEAGNIYRARTVVLAIGVRGNPRHLNLAGEAPGRVVYSLIEPQEFTGRSILVVGGGNAGAEVAQALAAPHLNNTVSYSFRAPVLTNVTPENAETISAMQKSKLIAIYPATALAEIRPQSVVLEPVKSRAPAAAQNSAPTAPIEIINDVIFAMIGAELPTAFLKSVGVRMVRKGRWQA